MEPNILSVPCGAMSKELTNFNEIGIVDENWPQVIGLAQPEAIPDRDNNLTSTSFSAAATASTIPDRSAMTMDYRVSASTSAASPTPHHNLQQFVPQTYVPLPSRHVPTYDAHAHDANTLQKFLDVLKNQNQLNKCPGYPAIPFASHTGNSAMPFGYNQENLSAYYKTRNWLLQLPYDAENLVIPLGHNSGSPVMPLEYTAPSSAMPTAAHNPGTSAKVYNGYLTPPIEIMLGSDQVVDSTTNDSGDKCIGAEDVAVTPKRGRRKKPQPVCEICSKLFRDSTGLKVHMRTHTKEKPFKCEFPLCNWKFAQLSHLENHRKVHTPRSDGKPRQNRPPKN